MSLFLVIAYDIADPKRLRRVAGEMENFGTRVQKSVFECHLTEAQADDLKARIERLILPEADRVRWYRLCPKDRAGVLGDGIAPETKDWDYHIV